MLRRFLFLFWAPIAFVLFILGASVMYVIGAFVSRAVWVFNGEENDLTFECGAGFLIDCLAELLNG